jgi:predicted RNase H-like HicB family nuclease
MQFTPVIIKDVKKDVHFVYFKDFPGICAQGKTLNEAVEKSFSYLEKYIDRQRKKAQENQVESELEFC